MNKNNKHLVILKRIIEKTIEKGGFQEACLFGRFLENNDASAVRILNKKCNRIFTEDEVKEMAKLVRDITNQYIPESIRGSVDAEAEFIFNNHSNIIPFRKVARN